MFKRRVVLYELQKNSYGETVTNILSQADWIKTPGNATRELGLPVSSPPSTETLFLQIDNEDNAPIDLENFRAFYPVSRLWFKATDEGSIDLFYGNQNVAAPNYDLSLVAGQLLSAEKGIAKPGAEEPMQATRSVSRVLDTKAGIIFWSVLALVVIGLLAVVSRLLPKATPKDR